MFNPYFEQSSIQWNKAITGSCSRHAPSTISKPNKSRKHVRKNLQFFSTLTYSTGKSGFVDLHSCFIQFKRKLSDCDFRQNIWFPFHSYISNHMKLSVEKQFSVSFKVSMFRKVTFIMTVLTKIKNYQQNCKLCTHE